MKLFGSVAGLLIMLLLQPVAASASIIGVTGAGDILVPDASPNTGMTANFFNDPGPIVLTHGWNELQNVALASDITVDIVAPGAYSAAFTSANAVLTAGTLVDSHYLYFDPINNTTGLATFEFDADIIGVIVLSDLASGDRLLASDFLRNPLTVAPAAHFADRGIEFGPEVITLALGLRSLTVDLQAGSPGDQIRVITQAVPEPSVLVLFGTGLLAGRWHLRSRSRRQHQKGV